jgi:tetratricopeptide (TPR) repeat protein
MLAGVADLALLYRDTGRYPQAEPLYQRAIVILDKSLPADHPNLALVRENYAILLDALGRADKAAALRSRPR